MHGARNSTIAALLGLGSRSRREPAAGSRRGRRGAPRPAVAIEKARAAAAREEQRAREHDAQAATTVDDDAPRAAEQAKASTTAVAAATRTHPRSGGGGAEQQRACRSRRPTTSPRIAIRSAAAAHGVVDARTPLETYQLGQLKLVGVIAQSSEGYRAMVEDSAGLGYIITTGTPIGSSGGVVRSIEPRRVVIEESTRDFYGDVKPKEVVMELPQEDRSP
jgi:hypothetical protein